MKVVDIDMCEFCGKEMGEKVKEIALFRKKEASQQVLSNLSATPRTLPNGNPNGEFNRNLKENLTDFPKSATPTSLNSDIKLNKVSHL